VLVAKRSSVESLGGGLGTPQMSGTPLGGPALALYSGDLVRAGRRRGWRNAGEVLIGGGLISVRGGLIGAGLGLVSVRSRLIRIRSGLICVGSGLVFFGARQASSPPRSE
jgi:hypothetical protein